jgi:5-methylcytosine-specific restriction endonuclease McrA
MIFLDRNSEKIKKAIDLHVSSLTVYVLKRTEKYGCNELKQELTEEYIKEILEKEPESICQIQSRREERINSLLIKNYKEKKIKVFDYDSWIKVNEGKKNKYTAYTLADNLDIRTCTYCNRLYTKTVKGKKNKITRPEFDHWLPKQKYPLYALSFYNLIPSCHVCNSNVKGSKDFTLEDNIHPYIDKVSGIQFSYYNKKLDKYKFQIKGSNKKEKNTIEALQLHEIYKTHEEEIEDLVLIKKRYSESYINSLKTILKSNHSKISTDEIYRLAFGVYYSDEDFHKRPLSKMKKDILKELNIIK